MPGPKSGVHGLICVVREGSCAAYPSAYLALVGLRCYSSRALGSIGRRRLRGSLPVPLRLVVLFSPCWGFSVFVLPVVVVAVPCGPRGLVCVLLLALSLVPWPPGVGFGVGLARLRVLRSWYFFFGVFDFGRRGYVFWSFLRHFPSCGGARQVERIAECSFRHLPHVAFSPGG